MVFKVEKHLSASAVVMGVVMRMFNRATVSDTTYWSDSRVFSLRYHLLVTQQSVFSRTLLQLCCNEDRDRKTFYLNKGVNIVARPLAFPSQFPLLIAQQ